MLICGGITLLAVRILYEFRALTFAVWTNAALIITVAAIELFIIAGIFAAIWAVAEFIASVD